MGRADFFDDAPYFVHVASTDVAKFDLHTQSSFDELCTLLVSEVSEGVDHSLNINHINSYMYYKNKSIENNKFYLGPI